MASESEICRTNKKIVRELEGKGFVMWRPLSRLYSSLESFNSRPKDRSYWESDLTIRPGKGAEYSNYFGEYDGKANKWSIFYANCNVVELGIRNLPQIRDALKLKGILDMERVNYLESHERNEIEDILRERVVPELSSLVEALSR